VFEYEHEYEESLGGLAVARAFQPEICPLRLGCPEIAARGWGGGVAGGWSHAKTRRREGRRKGWGTVFGVRGSVFEHEQEHEESRGVLSAVRAFQPEICPLRLGCPEIAARGWGALQAVGLTRRREDAKEDAKGGVRGSGYEHEHEQEHEESLGGARRSSGFPARAQRSAILNV